MYQEVDLCVKGHLGDFEFVWESREQIEEQLLFGEGRGNFWICINNSPPQILKLDLSLLNYCFFSKAEAS